MPKQKKKEEVSCQYYRWLLGTRNGVYQADGRSNDPPLGRHTLESRDRADAIEALKELDLTMAVEHGLADCSLLKTERSKLLDFATGRQLYEQYVKRPRVAGGPQASTAKRYRPVLDKFLAFAQGRKLQYWNQVIRQTFDAYASWLDGESYAYATEYLELNTLKQVLKFLVQHEHLPSDALFPYPMRKPQGTDTYCWRQEEVEAILIHCEIPELQWLRVVVLALSTTGLRISELANLRWTDIDFQRDMITLTDESTSQKKRSRERRTTKSGYSRSFPIHPELRPILLDIVRAKDGRVFHGPLGGKIKPDTVRRILIRDVLTPLAENFPNETDEPGFIDGRLHSFRHYFCSACANVAIPERMLMSWLGHRDSKMVHRYYHLHDEESQRQMARLSTNGHTHNGSSSVPDSR
ncbi:MAG: tyrosine-type recombinase/integrase [Planctomycetaceae bacterium]|nr:tyrosine-type recombinase/integrase [Planctomycetaceae bacterium]MCB9953596.1 tyrosine-type recombinase/integrase [Planctomycetaceae bacterium]